MEDYGLVSIITPSFNSADFIGETIESIVAQTYKNWELIITDDCSTDNTVEVVERYAGNDSRIKLLRLTVNSGAGVARNNSIRSANGRYIAFCDSDDRWHPDKLAKQLAFMHQKGCDISHTSYMTCNETGDITGIVVCRKKETLKSMCRDNKMGMLSVLYDTHELGKVYMPEIRKRQDYGLQLRLMQKGGFSYGLKEPLAYYRIRKKSISRNKRGLIKYNIAVYTEILGWSKLRATLYFYSVFSPIHIMKVFFQKYLDR